MALYSEGPYEPAENPHGCGFPDQACRSCEAAHAPPCCHTPYLCGGPHDDCAPPPGGYNEAPQAPAECACLNPDFGGQCCGKHEACTHDAPERGVRPAGAAGKVVVHVDSSKRCCITNGCGWHRW